MIVQDMPLDMMYLAQVGFLHIKLIYCLYILISFLVFGIEYICSVVTFMSDTNSVIYEFFCSQINLVFLSSIFLYLF